MAIKPGKVIRKKSKKTSGKVRDLSTRKDPRGGAQKKESPPASSDTLGGLPTRVGKNRLV